MGNYLKTPKLDKDHETKHNERLTSTLVSMQGWRMTMEDAHINEPDFDKNCSLFAIFDGHGGSEVALFAQQRFPELLKENEFYQKEQYKKALRKSLKKLDKQICSKKALERINELRGSSTGSSTAGTTALICLISNKDVYVASIGDCRGLLFDLDGSITVLNKEHSPEEVVESERIFDSGSIVSNGRVNESLNLTRSLGDCSHKQNKLIRFYDQAISSEPEIVEFKISTESLGVLIGCDGIYEVLSNVQIRDIIFRNLIESKDSYKALEEILNQTVASSTSILPRGRDNMSSILIVFHNE